MAFARATYGKVISPSGNKMLLLLVPTLIDDHELQTVAITKRLSKGRMLRTIHTHNLD